MNNQKKKVLDIIPPDSSNHGEDFVITNLLVKNRRPKYLLLFVVVVVGFVLVLSYISLLSVTIKIWPKYEKVVKSENVVFDTDIKIPDYINRRLPITVIQLSKDYSGNFTPKESVVKEEKAMGTVKLYNSTSSPQVLVKDTRLLSSEGKLFRLTNRITVPASTVVGGKITPGTIDSEVIAVESGESYNIEPATFSIPGFAGTAKYTSFYAKSFKPMTGGYVGKIGIVNDTDLTIAGNYVAGELAKIEEDLVNNELEKGLTLIEGYKDVEFENIEYTVEVGDLTDSFEATGKINIRFIAFDSNDLEKLAEKIINPESSSEELVSVSENKKTTRRGSIQIDIKAEKPDLKLQKGIVYLTVSGEVYNSLSNETIKNIAKGKTVKEIKEYLESQASVDRVKIFARPFLIGLIPGDVSRIIVEVVE